MNKTVTEVMISCYVCGEKVPKSFPYCLCGLPIQAIAVKSKRSGRRIKEKLAVVYGGYTLSMSPVIFDSLEWSAKAKKKNGGIMDKYSASPSLSVEQLDDL